MIKIEILRINTMRNMMIIFVSIIAISAIQYSFADLQSDTDTYLEKGIVLFQGRDTDTALKYFNAVLDIDSENVDALYYKSKILTKLEQKQDAISILEKILGMDLVHVGALELKADDLLKNEKFDEALIIYEDILKVEPNHARAQSALGDSLLQKGDDAEALRHYEIALQTDPRGKDVFGALFADKVLGIKPNHIDALNAKGVSLVQLDRSAEGFTIIFAAQLDSAISYFDRVLEIEPENTEALFNKGRSLIQKTLQKSDGNLTEEYQTGLALVRKALDISPNHVGALLYLGDRLMTDESYAKGLPYVERVLETEPDNVDAMFLKAILSTELKDYQTSATYYDKILQINPFHRLSADNFLYIAKHLLGYPPLEGNLDVTIVDSNGFLAAHFVVPKLSIMNHTIGQKFLDEWDVMGTEKRDGIDYQVLKYERELYVERKFIYGGATHYGISYPFERDIWKLYANYYSYYADAGDLINFTYTVYRPV